MGIRNSSALLFSVVLFALSWADTAYGETAPCALLTQNQVSSIVGASFGAGSPIANTGCSWTKAAAPRITVTVSMQSEKMFAAAKSSVPPETTKTPISGIGDDAIFTGVEKFSSLWVRKGATVLLVRIYGVSVSEAQTKLKTLATSALSKL